MLAKPRAYMIFPIAAASAAESGKIHSPQANFVQSVLAVGGKSKLNWRVQDGCGASFQVCNSGIVASSTSTKKVSECRYLGLPFREEDRKWSPKPGSL